jgi:tRNA A-37 threonylcarbamoyl transferase component Bud32
VPDAIAWQRGETGLGIEIARLPAGPGPAVEVLRERAGRRRLLRVRRGGHDLLVKHVFGSRRRHPVRDRIKGRLRLGAVEREWRCLDRLFRAGLAVPRPRAAVVLRGGSSLLAVDFLEGRSLRDALLAGDRVSRVAFDAIGDAIRALHDSGAVHGDLQPDNVLLTPEGPVLVDFALARRRGGARSRMRDLGELDQALSRLPGGSRPRRLRIALRALGLRDVRAPEARRALADLSRASEARRRAHVASRTRRLAGPGRLVASVDLGAWHGLRMRDVDPRVLASRLASDAAPADTASWRVREWRGRGPLLRAVDAVRGSPARRAWLAAHRQRLEDPAARRPLAVLEERRDGRVLRSLLVTALPGGDGDPAVGAR